MLISPQNDCDLSNYETVVYLDNPSKITLQSLSGKHVSVCSGLDGLSSVRKLETDREYMLGLFRYAASCPSSYTGENAEEASVNLRAEIPLPQIYFALKVFEELKLISFEGGRLSVFKGVKTQLTNSELYNAVTRLKT